MHIVYTFCIINNAIKQKQLKRRNNIAISRNKT